MIRASLAVSERRRPRRGVGTADVPFFLSVPRRPVVSAPADSQGRGWPGRSVCLGLDAGDEGQASECPLAEGHDGRSRGAQGVEAPRAAFADVKARGGPPPTTLRPPALIPTPLLAGPFDLRTARRECHESDPRWILPPRKAWHVGPNVSREYREEVRLERGRDVIKKNNRSKMPPLPRHRISSILCTGLSMLDNPWRNRACDKIPYPNHLFFAFSGTGGPGM